METLLNYPYCFDIIIIINRYYKSLPDLIKSILKQSNLLGKCQIILLNNNPKKKIINLCLNVIKNNNDQHCQIKLININKNQTINEIYQKISLLIIGEVVVFTTSNTYPDNKWLENLIKPFSENNINIIAGEICKIQRQNLLEKIFYIVDNFVNQDKFKLINIFDEQISNIAIKKEFLKKNKSLNFININQKEITFYYRILREVETEITYSPSAKVYLKI